MFIIQGENAFSFLHEKFENTVLITDIPEDRVVYREIIVRVDPECHQHVVTATAIRDETRILRHVCEPLTDDIEDVGYSIIIEFNDTRMRDFATKFIVNLYEIFESEQLDMIKINDFVVDPSRNNFRFSSVYIEFGPYSKQFFERKCVLPEIVFDYNESAMIGSDIASLETKFQLSQIIGNSAGSNRAFGDSSGLNNQSRFELFNEMTNAVVITDDLDKYNFDYFNIESVRRDSFLKSIIDINDVKDKLDEVYSNIFKQLTVSTLIVTKMDKIPPGHEAMQTFMKRLKLVLLYTIANVPFTRIIIMEPRIDVHTCYDLTTACQRHGIFILGPSNCAVLSPGNLTTGNIKSPSFERGNVAIITRDVTMMNKMVDIAQRNSHGVYECITLGESNLNTSCSFSECVFKYAQINTVHLIIVIESRNGRPPFSDIDQLVHMQENGMINKPILAWFSTEEDNKKLMDCGCFVPPSLDKLEPYMNNLYRQINDHINKEMDISLKFMEEFFKNMGVSIDECDENGDETILEQMRNSVYNAKQ